MLRDTLTWYMFLAGFGVIVVILYMELTAMKGWIDSENHDVGLIFSLGIAIAAIYYGHSRSDHVRTNRRLDEIQDSLDEIHEDVHDFKENFRKLKKDFDDFKKKSEDPSS